MERSCDTHGAWGMGEHACIPCTTAAMPKEDITCPFCGRIDFDLVGLKQHLQRWCEALDQIEDVN